MTASWASTLHPPPPPQGVTGPSCLCSPPSTRGRASLSAPTHRMTPVPNTGPNTGVAFKDWTLGQQSNGSFFFSPWCQRRRTEYFPSKGCVTEERRDANDSNRAQEMGWESDSTADVCRSDTLARLEGEEKPNT